MDKVSHKYGSSIRFLLVLDTSVGRLLEVQVVSGYLIRLVRYLLGQIPYSKYLPDLFCSGSQVLRYSDTRSSDVSVILSMPLLPSPIPIAVAMIATLISEPMLLVRS
jgi:hypothetical protein